SVFDVVADGLGELGHWLAEFHRLSHADVFDGEAMGNVQAKIDAADGWGLDQRVEETLTKLDLDGDAEFGRLSGGMKRRVLLARALVAGPDVLLLDEPSSMFDPATEQRLIGRLRTLKDTTIVLVTHRMAMLALVDRLIVFDKGRIVADGPRDEVMRVLNGQAARPAVEQGVAA
ncbi:MAG: ATP-binding cassette domain-containing protein, partial [Janthinobacterium sp.]